MILKTYMGGIIRYDLAFLSPNDIVTKGADFCGPRLIEFAFAGDRYMMQTIVSLKENYGYKEVGRFDSPYNSVSPSTLHTYFSPSRIFLFKDLDPNVCS